MGIFKKKQAKKVEELQPIQNHAAHATGFIHHPAAYATGFIHAPNYTQKPKIMNQIVLALLRHLLTFVGGTVVAKGLLDEATMTELIGGAISFISMAWMTVDKIKKKPE